MIRTGIYIFKIIAQKAYIINIIFRITLVAIPKVSNGVGVKVHFVVLFHLKTFFMPET